MESLADPYDHPDDVDCIYIPTSVYSNDDVYAIKCSCIGDNPCADESCECVKTCRVNYTDGKLVDEKLVSSNASIFECSDRCECGDSCKNRLSQKGPCAALLIASSGSKGYGVVANRFIPKGTFLCEYAGEISSEEVMSIRKQAPDIDWRYVITLNETANDGSVTKTFIDASKFGNVGRYLNHSCNPNSVLAPIRYDVVSPKIGIFATRDIKKGEECCYLYASADSDRSDTPCLCGSDNCCGFLPLGCYTSS